MKKEYNWNHIALRLKIGIVGAIIILIGDLLMGWGLKDVSKSGIEVQLSPYLNLSDTRMLLSAICGFSGVPLAVIGHYGIYQLMKLSSLKYARMYGLGNLCFLAFGGAGVHVSSVEAAYFYKYMSASGIASSFDLSIRFVSYFLVPLYIILIIGWAIMVGAFSLGNIWCLAGHLWFVNKQFLHLQCMQK